MASVTTGDFVTTAAQPGAPPFSLIEPKGLASRLAEELARAAHEFARDPRAFIGDLFADDTRDAKRRRRIYFGLAGALVIHAVLLTVIAVIGWRHLSASKEGEQVIILDSAKLTARADEPKVDIPKGDKNGGGGSGGLHDSPPATRGPLPPSSPRPQIVQPTAPPKPLPNLPVQATVVGPDTPPPAVSVPVGMPTGALAEAPAPGAGSSGGVGGGNHSGAGSGNGNGAGAGRDGGRGTDAANVGLPGGKDAINGPIPFNRLKEMPGSRGIVFTYRPSPMVTPEAQREKIQGDVLLRATFNADGTITDISVIRGLPYMTDSAIESLKHSRFRPAAINGQLVTVVGVPVRVAVSVQ